MATKKQALAEVAALVLSSARIGGVSCPAGSVLEGLPESIAEQYAGTIDAAPAAVEHAKANGAQTLQYADE